MSNKLTFVLGACMTALGLGLFAAPVLAVDGNPEATAPVVTDEFGENFVAEPVDPSTDAGEVVNPERDQIGTEQQCSTETTSCDEEAVEDATCDDQTDCEEVVEEPELWTVYLSLGTLVATVVLIIFINLALGHKK